MRIPSLFGVAIVVCLLSSPAQSTAPSLSGAGAWSQRFGDGSDQFALDVAVGPSGDIAIAGNFDGTISFGGSSFAGSTDMFVAQFSAAGAHLWSRAFPAANQQTVRGVAIDAAGNVVLVGYFLGSVDFGGGPLTSSSSTDIFVAKFDAGGSHAWSRRFGGTDVQRGRCVATDESGNVIIGGEIAAGSADFGGGALGPGLFVAKLDAQGTHLWSRSCGGLGGQVEDVQVDGDGSAVLVGSFAGVADFGGGPLTSAGGTDVFVAKLEPDQSFVWHVRAGDADNQQGTALGLDAAGGVVVVGHFSGALDLGGGALGSTGGTDVFAARFGAGGALQWSKRFGDAASQMTFAADATPSGHLVVSGFFSGTLDFGGMPLASAGIDDIFVARLDAAGNHVRSQQFGDASSVSHFYGLNVAVADEDVAVAFGEFYGTIDFGTGSLLSSGARDVFLARLDFGVPVDVAEGLVSHGVDVRVYPSPFGPTTQISYALPVSGLATLAIHDARGALLRTVVHGSKAAGRHSVRWDGRKADGEAAPAGVYFVRLAAGGVVGTRKVVVLDRGYGGGH